jgi:hypothetical protein
MSDMTISEFCNCHNACQQGREWAMANCADMAGVWATARPQWLMWIATRPGVMTARELRLCAVQAARSVEHLMADERSRDVIAVAARYADGLATDEELTAARAAAHAAYAAAVAYGAASDAASAAAHAAAYHVAAYVAAVVADAASAAYDADDADATADATAAWEATAAWLRENASPNFTPEEDR